MAGRAPRSPITRGQGNRPFPTSDSRGAAKRGQTVPYDMNGAPTGATGAAADIVFTPTGGIASTNVQTALAELDSEKLAATSYTAADVLTKLLTVDGSGSGLDADLLDGHDTSYFLARGNHTGTQLASTISDFSTAVGLSNAATATKLATGRTLAITGDLAWTSPSFDGSGNVTAAGTLATVNANTGAWGSATQVPVVTFDAKGRATAASNVTITPAFSSITATPTTLAGYGITDAQPLDSDLTTIAGLVATTDNFLVSVASAWASRTPAQVRTTLGISTTGSDTTYAFRANNLSDLASAPTARTNLGLSSMATQSASAVAITGGTAALTGTSSVSAAGTTTALFYVSDTGAPATGTTTGGRVSVFTGGKPTAADQRLGLYSFGATDSGGTVQPSTAIVGWSAENWGTLASTAAYLGFEFTPIGSTTRAQYARMDATGFSHTGTIAATGTLAGSNLTTGGNTTGNSATTTKLATARTIGITGDATWSSGSFDGSANVTAALTLATVNSNVGSFGSATQVAAFTVNAKGLTTAAANVTITPAVGSVTGLGTGVATALAVNVGSAGAFVTFNGALGTPSSGTLTNAAGLPIAGLVPSTSTAIGVGSIELGSASDTTITRTGAGDIAVEGNGIYRAGGTDVAVADGGTGFSTTTQGDIFYADAANSIAKLAKNTTATRYLSNTGTSNNPAWAQVDLSNGVTGDLPFANLVQAGAAAVVGATAAGDFAALTVAQTQTLLAITTEPSVTGLTLATGWTNLGGGTLASGYRKSLHGRVSLEGVVQGSGSATTTITTLPAGFRPSADIAFPVVANGVFGYVYISSAGVVSLLAGSTTGNVGLNSISFYV